MIDLSFCPCGLLDPAHEGSNPSRWFMTDQRSSYSGRDALRRLVRKALVHVRGMQPSETEIEALVIAEETDRLRHGEADGDSAGLQPPTSVVAGVGVDVFPPFRSTKTWMSEEELREAESARWFARTNGIPSVIDALNWFAQHTPDAVSAPTLKLCCAEFQIVKRCEGVRRMSLNAYRTNLGTFCAKFGERQPATITPKEMSDYLMQWEQVVTRRHKWQILSTFFSWLLRMRYTLENPVMLGMRSPKVPPPERFILKPAEAREILRRSKHTDSIGYWVLSMFAGMRTSEIKAVQQLPNPWSIIKLGPGVIDLSASVTKTIARTVPINETMRRWLRWMKARDLRFMPRNCWAKTTIVRKRALGERMQPLKRAGSSRVYDPRTFNLGRRSYISYRIAMPGVSFADVSLEVGNNEEIMRKHYFRRVTRRDAVKYFDLMPEKI